MTHIQFSILHSMHACGCIQFMDTAVEVGKNVKGALGREGWSHTKAADALGMSRGSFGHRVNGRISFTVAELQILADAMGVAYSSLVEIPERRDK